VPEKTGPLLGSSGGARVNKKMAGPTGNFGVVVLAGRSKGRGDKLGFCTRTCWGTHSRPLPGWGGGGAASAWFRQKKMAEQKAKSVGSLVMPFIMLAGDFQPCPGIAAYACGVSMA